MADPFLFEDSAREQLEKIDFNDSKLRAAPYLGELVHACDSLKGLISDPGKRLDERGYVLLIGGPYGAGKTTASWALVNELKKLYGDKLVFAERSLMPFGNPTESMSAFLRQFAEKLWQQGMVDIRRDINQFILEVTPATEPVGFEFQFGPFSLSKKFTNQSVDVTQDVIRGKFKRAVRNGKFAVIILDDLDRLTPEEIVQVMRMVEKLRTLPRVLIFLPIYKDVVTAAFKEIMALPGDAAPTFLRKLTDMQIAVENRLKDLQKTFIEELDAPDELDDWQLDELCWYMVLHNMILREGYALVEGKGTNAVAQLFDGRSSQYLYQLWQLFSSHGRVYDDLLLDNETSPYPTSWIDERDDNREKFGRLGWQYKHLLSTNNDIEAVHQVADLRKKNVSQKVFTDPTIITALREASTVHYPDYKDEQTSRPALMEVFLPRLKTSDNEPLVTNNYKLRDVLILARSIRGDHRFGECKVDTLALFDLVAEHFDRLR